MQTNIISSDIYSNICYAPHREEKKKSKEIVDKLIDVKSLKRPGIEVVDSSEIIIHPETDPKDVSDAVRAHAWLGALSEGEDLYQVIELLVKDE